MSVHPDGSAEERGGSAAGRLQGEPPKRSYTRRRAGVTAEVASSPGPKAAPTLVEAAAAVHREQARGSDSDVLPTMVERSPLGSEPGVELSPELAAFEAALARSGRGSSAPSSPSVKPEPVQHAGEEEGGVAKTLHLSPAELEVDRVAHEHESNAALHCGYDDSPTLSGVSRVSPPKARSVTQVQGEPGSNPLSLRLLVVLTVAALSAVLCAALLGWMVS